MNKYILTIIASMSLTIACGGDEFTTTSTGPKEPVPNKLTGTVCDSDNTDPVDCSGQDECAGIQFCEAGEWGLCDCEQSGESGGSSTGGTGGDVSGNSGGMPSGGASGGETSTGGSGVCIPKTCDEITLELNNSEFAEQGTEGSACANHNDGCGGIITCDSCQSDWHYCGGNRNTHLSWVMDNTFPERWEGISGMCSGGCINQASNEMMREFFCNSTIINVPEVSSLDDIQIVSCAQPESTDNVSLPENSSGMTCDNFNINLDYGIGVYCCY